MSEYHCTEKKSFEYLTKSLEGNNKLLEGLRGEITEVKRNDSKMELAVEVLSKRLDAVEVVNAQLGTLTTNMAVMVEQLTNMNEKFDVNSQYTNSKIDSIAGDVETLKGKDGDNLTFYKRQIVIWFILLILGATIGVVLK